MIDKDAKQYKVMQEEEKNATTNAGLIIYPNPIRNGEVNLHFKNEQTGVYDVVIQNQQGQVVKTITLQVQSKNMQHSLQLGAVVSGSYQAIITNKNGYKKTISFVVF
jgi:hypothetical protein